ncbi:hypothetical protein BBP40_010912 [Aspergillus hancockii]|nr:hypothetical protein BBP40_010912 [Aspergillus hancockii]
MVKASSMSLKLPHFQFLVQATPWDRSWNLKPHYPDAIRYARALPEHVKKEVIFGLLYASIAHWKDMMTETGLFDKRIETSRELQEYFPGFIKVHLVQLSDAFDAEDNAK